MSCEKYLPIGTVVLLKEGQKRIMIYGRKQVDSGTGKEWDYAACLYPEGNISGDHVYLFQHDQIEKIFFIGFQDEEELIYAGQCLEVADA